MRSIAILVFLLGLAVCRLAAAAPPADCRPAGAPDAAGDRPVDPACRDPGLSGRITERGRGFWTLDDAAAEPGWDAAGVISAAILGASSASARARS
jgi:hypothetical protein